MIRLVIDSCWHLVVPSVLGRVPGLFHAGAEDGEKDELEEQQPAGHVKDRVPGFESGLYGKNNCKVISLVAEYHHFLCHSH